MANAVPGLSVAVVEPSAFIRVSGKADVFSSGPFKQLVAGLRARGCELFVLDLRDCITMDSTFLGTLSGLALQHLDERLSIPQTRNLSIELLHPNTRVIDLLDTLGVIQFFTMRQQETPPDLEFEPVAKIATPPRKQELNSLCLEAHKKLMELNEDNVPKFKDVVQFLTADLEKDADK